MCEVVSCEDFQCIERACEALNNNGIIVVPTIRWYMVATLANNEGGIQAIFTAKDRSRKRQPLFVVPYKSFIFDYFCCNNYAERLVNDFLPGELTLRLSWKETNRAKEYCVNRDTALVSYQSGILGDIARKIGVPIATTTPNISSDNNSAPALCLNEVKAFVDSTKIPVALIVDGGFSVVSTPTTIVDCTDVSSIPTIEREGYVCRRIIDISLKTLQQ